ncbi:GNAT family N-acetyltransferase [Acinetobacter larvae]|uniref:GNAT family N-acetyltransferase n=1 Tax=Acinetobacter larvae TaxID=1789224 RepID=A0A1B2M1F6_9GAMM|nr:GNAT family N-acetyltransferase [Acinetobacter larvae]AOA59018.1 GNAT family N-acetyltransferase [Acinetobacter larvae]
MHISSPRLILRAWQRDDLPIFAAMNNDPKVMQYFPKPLSRSESDALAALAQSFIATQGWGFWAVELKHNHQFIGMVGLHAQPDKFSFSPCVEIGWRIDAAHWRCGYATEAAQHALKFAFEQLKLSEVVAFTAQCNTPSQQVMQKLGMQYRQDFIHPDLAADHPLAPHVLYAITRESFYQMHPKYPK